METPKQFEAEVRKLGLAVNVMIPEVGKEMILTK